MLLRRGEGGVVEGCGEEAGQRGCEGGGYVVHTAFVEEFLDVRSDVELDVVGGGVGDSDAADPVGVAAEGHLLAVALSECCLQLVDEVVVVADEGPVVHVHLDSEECTVGGALDVDTGVTGEGLVAYGGEESVECLVELVVTLLHTIEALLDQDPAVGE